MGGVFHYYFDAARALWEKPSEELYAFARGGDSDAMRRAAELTLRLKAEYVTPEAFRDERTVLTRLASALSEDPEFPMDLAVKLGRARSANAPQSQDIRWVTRRSRRSIMLWVAVASAVALLVLDVLATAGAPVPTPIGDFLDRVTGEDVTPVTPAPPAPTDGGAFLPPRESTPGVTMSVAGSSSTTTDLETGDRKKRQDQPGLRKEKNGRSANGRDRNFANGLVRHAAESAVDAVRSSRERWPGDRSSSASRFQPERPSWSRWDKDKEKNKE